MVFNGVESVKFHKWDPDIQFDINGKDGNTTSIVFGISGIGFYVNDSRIWSVEK